ncbi:MAG: TetR/AcrR family transcriptional regulator [Planctomycetota bacterium]
MRVSKAQSALNRGKILDMASKMFCEHGIDGIGIADLMKETGLTHGCLYGHFESKQALVAATCTHSLTKSARRWTRIGRNAATAKAPRAAIIKHYLGPKHLRHVGEGCLLAALATEVVRQDPNTRQAFTDGVRQLAKILAEYSHTASPAQDLETSLATMASLVGAIVLARAVDDPQLSEQILSSTKAALDADPHDAETASQDVGQAVPDGSISSQG